MSTHMKLICSSLPCPPSQKIMPSPQRQLHLCLLLALTACGGTDPATQVNESYSSLNARDYSGAEAGFAEALPQLEPGTSVHLRAQLGLFRARSFSDSASAKTDFLAYASANDLEIGDYTQFITDLVTGEHLEEAIAVVSEMKKAFPDNVKVDDMGNALVERAKSAGDTSALDALSGLGYVGND